MDVKDAIDAAKSYVRHVYSDSDEPISHLGLEETVFDDDKGVWMITVAFSRPWNTPRSRSQEMMATIGSAPSLKRSFKVVTLRNDDGKVLAMKNRESIDAVG